MELEGVREKKREEEEEGYDKRGNEREKSHFLPHFREGEEGEQLYRAQSKLWFMFDICLSGKSELFSVEKKKNNEIESV